MQSWRRFSSSDEADAALAAPSRPKAKLCLVDDGGMVDARSGAASLSQGHGSERSRRLMELRSVGIEGMSEINAGDDLAGMIAEQAT